MRQDSSFTADVIKGAVAGAVATWAMGQITTLNAKRREPDTALHALDRAA